MMRKAVLIFIALVGLSSIIPRTGFIDEQPYLSPTHICCDREAGKAFISLSTATRIAVVDVRNNRLQGYVDLPFNPGGMALSRDKGTLMVADLCPEGKVHFISLAKGGITRSIKVGHTPDGLAITPDGQLLFAANRFSNTVSVIDMGSRKVIKTIAVLRDPKVIAVSPNGKTIAVANHIPDAASTDPFISAKISLIDRNYLEVSKHVALTNGSQSVEGLAFSKDGKYLYASHVLSRNNLPTSQIEHGWINSNALSVIDIDKKEYCTSVLLDNYNRGAANPGGMVVSEDGSQLMVALSGVHEICLIDLAELHRKLDETEGGQLEEITNDLRFLNGIKRRIPIRGKSPRHLALFGDHLLVSSYFSSGLEIINNPGRSDISQEISLGDEPMMSMVRRGELLFCDADLCFQNWQSCTSCHPGARVDGLNWDLLNDGAGNPKNDKSLLYAHYTPPVMITGIRDKAETAVRAGLKFILFTEYEESDAQAIDAYLRSLEPVPSPHLVEGKLNKDAKKGKLIFDQAGCNHCHSGKYYTDGKKYDVGTGLHTHEKESFDVPGLSEIWRTAPYLYDGRAKIMKEVFTIFNPGDAHGSTSGLTAREVDWLVEYVMSL